MADERFVGLSGARAMVLAVPTSVTQTTASMSNFCRAALNAARMTLRPLSVCGQTVQPHVFIVTDKLKVLNAVVARFAIDVMHDLVTAKQPSEVLFHHKTVLPVTPTIRRNSTWIRLRGCGLATPSVVTLGATVPPAVNRKRCEVGTAVVTDARLSSACRLAAFHRTVPRIASSVTRRTNRECLATLLAGTLVGHGSHNLSCRAGGVRSTARLHRADCANYTLVTLRFPRLDKETC